MLHSDDDDTTTDVNSVDSDGVHDLDMIGVKVRKKFGSDWFDGEVISVTGPGLYKVTYEDGDREDLNRIELHEHELAYEQHYLFF